MWRKYWGLAFAAGIGIVAGAMGGDASGSMVIFLPFVAIANGLRALSLAGGLGDVCAWTLYALLSLLPLVALMPRGRKRGWADALTLITVAYGFVYWYAMANPSLYLPGEFKGAEGAAEVMRYMLTIMLLALYFGIAAFRLTEEDDGTRQMLSRLSVALYCVSLLVCAASTAGTVLIIRAGVAQGGFNTLYTIVQCACSLAVVTMLILTLESARALLRGMRTGWFSEGNDILAEKLSKRARRLLAFTIVCDLIQNGLALCMIGQVSNASVAYDLPLIEFVLACALLLLARFVRDGVKLKRENETFV